MRLVLVLVLAILAVLVSFYPQSHQRQRGGGIPGEFCRRDAQFFARRFKSKAYRSPAVGPAVYQETGPVDPWSAPPAGHPPLTDEPDAAPFDQRGIPCEESISKDLNRYTAWLTRQHFNTLNPEDRANLRIVTRGGRLTPEDIPVNHTPPPWNGERAWRLLTNTEHLAEPEYLGYLPWNFTEADEKQKSLFHLTEINPNERLQAWELTHIHSQPPA